MRFVEADVIKPIEAELDANNVRVHAGNPNSASKSIQANNSGE